jgi:hypothetical protein
MTTLSSYLPIANNLAKWQAITAKSPANATQTKYFQDNICKVKSAADLMKNSRLFNYAMSAFGLGDRTYAKGLMTQVLKQGVASSATLANKLNDPNILAFAKAFDFAANGANTTSSSTLVSNVVNRYTENALEADQGKQNPGVQLALYFQQHAPSVTGIYGILADKSLLTVAQTALGISPLTGLEPIDTQASLLGAKLNIADFKDPKKLQAFIARFAAGYDATNGGATPTSSTSTNAILLGASTSNSSTSFGIDPTLLLGMQGRGYGAF